MEINRNAWHYKIYMWGASYSVRHESYTSLCTYCQTIMLKLFMSIFVTLAVLMLTFIVGLCVWSGFLINPCLLTFVFVLIGATVYCAYLYDKYKYDPRPRVVNIITEYIAAKKENVCPTIYFKDAEY